LGTAWHRACEILFSGVIPSIDQVKTMERGQAFRLLEETASEANAFSRKRGNTLPFIQKGDKSSGKINAQETIKVSKTRSPAKLIAINYVGLSPAKPTTSSVNEGI
jgi:hypothetical protein